MRELIANVHAAGEWWGPDYGNAARVPAEVADEIANPDVWLEIPDTPTTQTPDVPSLDDWLAASTGDEVLAFVNQWVDAPDRDRVILEFVSLERAGENRQDVVDTLVAALPPVPMTPEELAREAERAAAREAARPDSGSTPPQITDEERAQLEAAEAAAALAAWVADSSIDVIDEEVAKVTDPTDRSDFASRVLAVEAESAKPRKGLVRRLGQYLLTNDAGPGADV